MNNVRRPCHLVLNRALSEARGIVGAWPMIYGSAPDVSGHGNNATAGTARPSRTMTPFGYGCSFNRSTQSWNCGSNPSCKPSLPVTVCIVYSISSHASQNTGLFSVGSWTTNYSGIVVYSAQTTGTITTYYGDGLGNVFGTNARSSGTSEGTTINTWYVLFVQVVDLNTFRTYLNGVKLTNSAPSGTTSALAYESGASTRIGRTKNNSDTQIFGGSMALAILWNRALSERSIRMLSIDPFAILYSANYSKLSHVPLSYLSMAGSLNLLNTTAGTLDSQALFAATVQNEIALQSNMHVPISIVASLLAEATLSGSLASATYLASVIANYLLVGSSLTPQAFLAGTMQLGVGLTSTLFGAAPISPFMQSFSPRHNDRVSSHTNRRTVTEADGSIEVQDLPANRLLNGSTLYIKRGI